MERQQSIRVSGLVYAYNTLAYAAADNDEDAIYACVNRLKKGTMSDKSSRLLLSHWAVVPKIKSSPANKP